MQSEDLTQVTATVEDTRQALLTKAVRTGVPIRKTFVQTPRSLAVDRNDLSGPLSMFVRNRDPRALQAYLMIVAVTSSGAGNDGWSTTHPIMVWARAFGTTRDAERSSAANAVSKILHRLEDRRLVERTRRGRARKIRVTLLREDGSGEPYTRPHGKAFAEQFFTLNHAFWLDGWCDRLKLPGLAMLLVALRETGPSKPCFTLPTAHMPKWYGWSADTAERGLSELQEHKLLLKVPRLRKEPLSASGWGRINEYYPLAPFGVAETETLITAVLTEGTEITE